jgi:hypothetical protein
MCELFADDRQSKLSGVFLLYVCTQFDDDSKDIRVTKQSTDLQNSILKATVEFKLTRVIELYRSETIVTLDREGKVVESDIQESKGAMVAAHCQVTWIFLSPLVRPDSNVKVCWLVQRTNGFPH